MLDVVNCFANGFVAIPVIDSCRRGGLFDWLSSRNAATPSEIALGIKANEGHLRVALRMLHELSWLQLSEDDLYYCSSERAEWAKQIPSDAMELVRLAAKKDIFNSEAKMLRKWLARAHSGWGNAQPDVVELIDGALMTPVFVELSRTNGVDLLLGKTSPSHSEALVVLEALRDLFVLRGWGQRASSHGYTANFTLSPPGKYLIDSGNILGTVASYNAMLSSMDKLLFGDPRSVFGRDATGHELHIDRTLNVVASGVQHQSYFAAMQECLGTIFDCMPIEKQPRYVADMGCGDGSLLRRVYEFVLTQTARGQVLSKFPLQLIGIDFNERSLESTAQTLRGLPHVLLSGDAGNPAKMIADLAMRGIDDPQNILHLRSFLDHDRVPQAPVDLAAVMRRRHIPYSGVYVDSEGAAIPPEVAVQSLVEHLRRWADIVSDFGLTVLEVHCLRPQTVRQSVKRSESLHFDAYHAFSGQQLVEASVFLMSAAEAGLFPNPNVSRCFPRTALFTRITLNSFQPRPYIVRHPVPADIALLEQLEFVCLSEELRTTTFELQRRVGSYPQGQAVLEFQGEIVAALYSQRIERLDMARLPHAQLSQLHNVEGQVVQLLGLCVHPRVQGLGLGDQLIDLMLAYFSASEGVEVVVGVTRCLDFQRHRDEGLTHAEYIRWQDDQGQLIDRMLRFHASHGAIVREVIPFYRPQDISNDGFGVLIEYQIRPGFDQSNCHRAATLVTPMPSLETRANPLQAGVIDDQVSSSSTDMAEVFRACIQRLIGAPRAAAYSLESPLMEIGLGSLELLELRYLLGQQLGRELDATFFFRFGTPAAVIQELQGVASASGTSTQLRPVSQPSKHDSEPIAVVGIGCRFPGAADVEQFWKLLRDGHDAVDRPSTAREPFVASSAMSGGVYDSAGYLDQIDRFDEDFFRISPREARLLDPQQRMLLEVVWEALENAGCAPARLKGSQTGVYVGAINRDYETLLMKHGDDADVDAYYATGNASSMAAGRLAYFFDWHGPTLTVDTACSSSLVAVHLACRSLRAGDCEMAIAAGVNLLLGSEANIAFQRAGMLSADRRCKTFDATADGYVRGEGCGVLVLKTLSAAQRDGDNVLAIIRGSAINQDGASSGLTAPNQNAQQAVIELALNDAGLKAHQISYLEAHGTGTSLGDPIEVQAAAAVLGTSRLPERPLLIGSVKTNIGHLEAAAGIAAVIKVVLSLRYSLIPKHLHFHQPSKHIPWHLLPIRVTCETQPWPGGKKIAGINSFGFSGTNAHVIIEEPPSGNMLVSTELRRPDRSHHVLTISANGKKPLLDVATRYLDWLEARPAVNLTDMAYTSCVARSHLNHRAALVVGSWDEAHAKLQQLSGRVSTLAESQATHTVFQGQFESRPKLAWLFRGTVSADAALARELYDTQPVLREVLDRCNEQVAVHWGVPLLDVLFDEAPVIGEAKDQNLGRSVALCVYAFEVALAELWRSWGFEPDVVLGDGVGEYVAAVVAGVFSMEVGVELIAWQFCDENRLKKPTTLLNSAATLTSKIQFHPASRTMICNLTNRPGAPDQVFGLDFWFQQAGKPKPYLNGIGSLAGRGVDVLLGVSPPPTSPVISEYNWPDSLPQPSFVESLSISKGASFQLASAVADLYVRGLTPDFAGWDRPWQREKLYLPTYPFQRHPCWFKDSGPITSDNSVEGYLYQLGWHVKNLTSPLRGESSANSECWLILADRQGWAASLTERFEQQGQQYSLLYRDELPANNAAAMKALKQQLSLFGQSQQHVVHLWSLDQPLQLDGAKLQSMPLDALSSSIGILQLLAQQFPTSTLHLVTKGAQAVCAGDDINPFQSPLWGLGRVASLELPDQFGGLVDLPAEAVADLDWADRLLSEFTAFDDEDQVALRADGRYVVRLQALKRQAGVSTPVRADASYLITGGTGALGLETSQWLAEMGAGHLILVSRRPPTAESNERIDEIRTKYGCVVILRQVDISDSDAVSELFAEINAKLPPLQGVFHAAGLVATQPLTEISTAELTEVLAAKVQGTWLLHQHTESLELDFFVLFSSIASVWGSVGQGHYAAANAFLDGLSHYRQKRGLAAISINFGPWSAGGMATKERQDWLRLNGVRTLTSAMALKGFQFAQGLGLAQAVVADVDWSRFQAIYQARRRRMLFDELPPNKTPKLLEADSPKLLKLIQSVPLAQRRSQLEGEIREMLGRVLRQDPQKIQPRVGFFEMGLDSMMAVEFRSQLEQSLNRSLPVTLVMDQPRLVDLVDYLLTETLGPSDQASIALSPSVGGIQPAAVIAMTSSVVEPIAIVGLACRTPGAVDAESFWRLLNEGHDAITEVPADRWDIESYFDADPEKPGRIYTRYGGFLDQVDHFDASLFGIAPREAISLDPQQRILLEVVWEALENASISPKSPNPSNTGVFVGVGANEYGSLLSAQGVQSIDAHFVTGNALNAIAGRVAFALGFEGPTMAVDTACSSSLVAVHQACQALRNAECDMAVAGGVNLLLCPKSWIAICRAKMLASDGRCKTFDASADGYVRAEGCAALVLKRLSDAQSAGDRVLAVIRGSAVNQDGASSGLTVPRGPAQQRVISAALRQAGLQPKDVTYLEAHGTGTSLGDPIEVQAAAATYGHSRSIDNPLLIGSVKSNIGHLEAASGVIGMVKVVLAMQHSVIPKQLHFHQPSPHIPWQQLPVQIASEQQPWPPGRKIAGISSFGFSGTNAHVVLEEAPAIDTAFEQTSDRNYHLLVLSARDESALRALAGRYLHWFDRNSDACLADIAYTAGIGRTHLEQRVGMVVSSLSGARELLKLVSDTVADSVEEQQPQMLFRGNVESTHKLAWLFSGSLRTDPKKVRELYETQPVVRRVLDRCAAIFLILWEMPLLDLLFRDATDIGRKNDLCEAQYANAAAYSVELALAELWLSWGIQPDIMLGRGVGELVAAAVAGVFTPEHGLVLAAQREYIRGQHSSNTAFSEHLQSYVAKVQYKTAKRSLICSESGQLLELGRVFGEQYWIRQPLEVDRFSNIIASLAELGASVVLEIGSESDSFAMAKSNWPDAISAPIWITSLHASHDSAHQLARAMAELYVLGLTPDFVAWDQPWRRSKIDLPRYPFQRKVYWFPTTVDGKGTAPIQNSHPLMGLRQQLATDQLVFLQEFSCQRQPWLNDHILYETVVVGGATYVAMALCGGGVPGGARDVVFYEPLLLSRDSAYELQMLFSATENQGERRFDVFSRTSKPELSEWVKHASGIFDHQQPYTSNLEIESIEALQMRLKNWPVEKLFEYYADQQLELGETYRAIHSIWRGSNEALAELIVPDSLAEHLHGEPIHPALLDACTQVTGAAQLQLSNSEDVFYAPLRYERVTLYQPVPHRFFCYAKAARALSTEEQTRTFNLQMLSPAGRLLGHIEGFTLKRAPRKAFLRSLTRSTSDLLLQMNWREKPRALASSSERYSGRLWLIVTGQNGVGERLAQRLGNLQQECLLIREGTDGLKNNRLLSMQIEDVASWQRLLNDDQVASRLQGVIYLLGMDAEEAATISADSLRRSVRYSCGGLLSLVQSLLKARFQHWKGLWLVTSNSLGLNGDDVCELSQSTLWGMGRSLQREHAELNCHLVDVSRQISDNTLDELVSELTKTDRENQVALRGDRRLVPRLVKGVAVGTQPIKLREDASYLVTGGLGGIGLHLVQWLVEQGARHLMLNGRNPTNQHAQATIDLIRERGVQVEVCQADVSSEVDVRRVLNSIDQSMPQLAGIFHLSAVLRDGSVLQQNWEDFEAVLAPKLQGAWHLHVLTQNRPLDLFVMFSSAVALLGNPGQANYGAANAFLDSLANYRRAHGLPGTSINWGAWSEVGVAARNSRELSAHLNRAGWKWINPQQCLKALGTVLADNLNTVAVIAADWAAFNRRYGNSDVVPLLSELVDQPVNAPTTLDDSLRRTLDEASPQERRSQLIEFVGEEVKQVMGLELPPRVTAGFAELGMDSLMAVEIRNRLQAKFSDNIPYTVVFEYPNLSSLADYLSGLIEAELGQRTRQSTEQLTQQHSTPLIASARLEDLGHADEAFLNRLNEMSDEEAEELLMRKLGIEKP